MDREKIIIFGTGGILQSHLKHIDFGKVLAFADNNCYLQHTKIYGIPVINPEQIKDYCFEYIVIFNMYDADMIYKQLVEKLAIPEEKIISWRYYLYIHKYKAAYISHDAMHDIETYITQMGLYKLLDIDMGIAKLSTFTKKSGNYLDISKSIVYGYHTARGEYLPIYSNIYEKNIDINLFEEQYDAILLLDFFMKNSLEDAIQMIEQTFTLSRYVIMTIPYSYPKEFTEWNQFDFSKFGKVWKKMLHFSQLIIIDKNKDSLTENVRLYVATHKTFQQPDSKNYIPIHAGHKCSRDIGYAGDDTGEHISELNPLINECTALYWMWKNADCQYIGLNHYRRYFLKNTLWSDMDNILDGETIIEFMKEYDIIVANSLRTYPFTIKEHLKTTMNEEAFEFGFCSIRNMIAQKHLEYLSAFDECFSGHVLYPCNLFITRKEIMDQYCKWLFSIILEPAQTIDVTSYDAYSKRVIGFFAERLLTVWLLKQEVRIKELPTLILE